LDDELQKRGALPIPEAVDYVLQASTLQGSSIAI